VDVAPEQGAEDLTADDYRAAATNDGVNVDRAIMDFDARSVSSGHGRCGANSSRGFAAVACPPFDRATSSLCAFRMSSIDHAIGSP
jgi:hypothetical protein